MPNQNRVKQVKIAVIVFAAIFVCGYMGWRDTEASASEPQSQRRFEIVGIGEPLAARVGIDDGAAFAIHFVGNTHGGLEPCG